MSKRSRKRQASTEETDGMDGVVPELQAPVRQESDAPECRANDNEPTLDQPELTLVHEQVEDAASDAEPAIMEGNDILSTDADNATAKDDLPVPNDDQPQSSDLANALSEETGLADGESINTAQVVEALLFASDNPLTLPKIVSIIGVGSAREIRKLIATLNERYEQQDASFRIVGIAGGYQMMTLPAFNTWIRRLKQTRQESRLSPPAMETLAVVAYKQPVVRAEIEAIRGVSAGEMLNRLRELGLVKIVGRAEDVGRPILYGTTKRFLEVFGLSGLEDLPEVEEFGPPPG